MSGATAGLRGEVEELFPGFSLPAVAGSDVALGPFEAVGPLEAKSVGCNVESFVLGLAALLFGAIDSQFGQRK